MSRYAVFDGHCDTATELWARGQSLEDTACAVSLPQARQLAGYGQFFAFCTPSIPKTGASCPELLERSYGYFLRQLERYDHEVCLCRNGEDYDTALAQGKAAAFLALEGAEGIDCDPGRLERLAEMGFRMITLTWNADNGLAGCAKEDGPGLSRQGRDFVRRAQALGILVDVSHISDRAFWDVLDVAEKPVVASHSNSRALCGHWRNLSDQQFLALCRHGGSTGINLYSLFLAEDGDACLETVYRHIDHFLELGGEGHVALGGDLDGCDRLPRDFAGLRDYEKLSVFLERKGYAKETIAQIYSNTLKRIVTRCTI